MNIVWQDSDFIGFQFNGVHSNELHIFRVSNGDRYEDTIIPTFKDKTQEIAGGDGTLFWESFYTQKQITIPIAFDNMTESDYRRMRQVFNGKDTAELIFDETPYKYYMAKLQSPPQLKTICFTGKDGQRIYKGEGTLQFICYYPYAKSVHKFLDEYSGSNKSQWHAASGMRTTISSTGIANEPCFDSYYETTNNYRGMYTYNPGDLEADFCLYVPFDGGIIASDYVGRNARNWGLWFSTITRATNDSATHICINTRTNLIEGCIASVDTGTGKISATKTGTLYNEYITSGEFIKIPVSPLGSSSTAPAFDWSWLHTPTNALIEYDYIYY